MKKHQLIFATILSLSLIFGSCAKATVKNPVVVATMLDSEGAVLGNMILQMLQDQNIKTVNKINFGTPDILRKALENAEVDLIVDYTGSGQYYYPADVSDPTIFNDPIKGYQWTEAIDRKKMNIRWLTPSNANNTESIALKREFATANQIVTMQDLAAYINSKKTFKLICSASFAENTLGLLGFETAYGFKLTNDQLIILSSGNTSEMLLALSQGTNNVNASLVYGTDGALDKMNLVVVEDPKHIPPVYLPTPVIRGKVLEVYPEIKTILKPVFEALTLEILQSLNAQVAYDGRNASDVAHEFLTSHKFLTK